MNVDIEPTWKKVLQPYFKSSTWHSLLQFVEEEYQTKIIHPNKEEVFSAFNFCPFNKVRVVILGQDPYHGTGQAHGLSFSVQDGIKTPPSLRNILKELDSDIGKSVLTSNDLTPWAKQGVLLLNSVLTVEHKSPASHANKGWEEFTDHVIKTISDNKESVVFILWGAYAQKKSAAIDTSKHHVIHSPHPSPFSVHKGFFDSKPFSQVNNYLDQKNLPTIMW